MKFTVIASATLAMVSALEQNKPIPQVFPTSCTGDVSKCTGENLCCTFTSADNVHSLSQCMTTSDRATKYTGKYTDNSETVFNWKCPEPKTDTSKTGGYTLQASLSAGALVAAYYMA